MVCPTNCTIFLFPTTHFQVLKKTVVWLGQFGKLERCLYQIDNLITEPEIFLQRSFRGKFPTWNSGLEGSDREI